MKRYIDTVKEVLGAKGHGYHQLSPIETEDYLPLEICSIQDCNMAGEYLRNFFIQDGRLMWFISNTNYFDLRPYGSEKIRDYIWKRTLKQQAHV